MTGTVMLWTCCSPRSAVAGIGDPGTSDSVCDAARPESPIPATATARSCFVETERLIAATILSTSGNAAYS